MKSSDMMKNPDRSPNEQPRVDDPRPETQTRAAEAPQKSRAHAPSIDPYDMRAEPQLEEPGYGHGV